MKKLCLFLTWSWAILGAVNFIEFLCSKNFYLLEIAFLEFIIASEQFADYKRN